MTRREISLSGRWQFRKLGEKTWLPDRKADDYLIRVNRQPVARDTVLQEGDRVTMTPTKIEGAVTT